MRFFFPIYNKMKCFPAPSSRWEVYCRSIHSPSFPSKKSQIPYPPFARCLPGYVRWGIFFRRRPFSGAWPGMRAGKCSLPATCREARAVNPKWETASTTPPTSEDRKRLPERLSGSSVIRFAAKQQAELADESSVTRGDRKRERRGL